MRGQEGLERVDPTGVQLLERAAQSLAPGLPSLKVRVLLPGAGITGTLPAVL